MNKSAKNRSFALIGGILTSLLISIGSYYYHPFDLNPQGIFASGIMASILIFGINKFKRKKS